MELDLLTAKLIENGLDDEVDETSEIEVTVLEFLVEAIVEAVEEAAAPAAA